MTKIIQVAKFTGDGTQLTREFASMGGAGEQMARRIREGAQSIPPALRAVDASAGVAREKMESLAASTGSVGTVLRALGPIGLASAVALGGVTLALTALNSAARTAVTELGGIDASARRIGVSTTALQEWRFAALGAGAAAESADFALTSFAAKLGEATLQQSGGAYNSLRALEFSPQQIAQLRDVEEALPRIANRIAAMGSETERLRVARELGLEPLLGVLAQGEGAFDRAAENARRLGYVIDADLLSRAREMNGEWAQASAVIDVQLKSSLIELAPTFIEVAESIGIAISGLRDFLDLFADVERISMRNADERLTGLTTSMNRLANRWGSQVMEGGDASRARDPRALSTLVLGDGVTDLQSARNYYARLQQEADVLLRRIIDGNELGRTPSAPTAARPLVNAGLQRQQQLVDGLREELAERQRLLAVRADFPKASEAETQSLFDLREAMRTLELARAAGVAISDEEMERLRGLAQARYDEAEAARRQAETMARLNAQASTRDRLRDQLETPEDRIRREIGELQKQSGLSPEEVARGVARLNDELRELAAAQFEASAGGRALQEALDGQVRSLDDLRDIVLSIVQDAVVREIMSGGLMGGDVGGFLGGVWDRIGQDVSGSESGWGAFGRDGGSAKVPGLSQITEAAQGAASALAEGLTPSISKSASEIILGTVASGRETLAKHNSSASLAIMTKAANSAAGALARISAASGDEGSIGKQLLSSFIKSGPRAGGGNMHLGARHQGAELGAEIAIFGGWGQVAPNNAVQGLSVLAQLARGMPAAPAVASGPPTVNISIRDESGAQVAVESASSTVGADGAIDVELVLGRTMAGQVQRGSLDRAVGQRYNLKPQRVRRG